jgi:hypothetical protein
VQQPVDPRGHQAPNPPAAVSSAADSRGWAGTAVYAIALVLSAVILGVGIFLAVENRGLAMLAAGSASLVGVLVTWPLARAIVQSGESESRRRADLGTILSERLQQLSVLLNVVSEQQLLSDRAKQVAFRDKDRDALRRAIKEDLSRKDWEAALALVTDMENTFGYKQEAEQYREEINKYRAEVVHREIQSIVAKIDNFCRQEKWNEALRESERLHRHYPENDQVQKLPQEIENRRQGTKRQLLDAWNEAIARKDVDGSIEILKKLDLYLTRQEAESMQEAARGVFKEKLNQLGAQFTLAVQDKRFPEAVRVGEIITRDFPNSGIAREVRELMESLRTRAEPEMAKA